MAEKVGEQRYDWRPYYEFSAERPPREMLGSTAFASTLNGEFALNGMLVTLMMLRL